jgi:hypothetical protein
MYEQLKKTITAFDKDTTWEIRSKNTKKEQFCSRLFTSRSRSHAFKKRLIENFENQLGLSSLGKSAICTLESRKSPGCYRIVVFLGAIEKLMYESRNEKALA